VRSVLADAPTGRDLTDGELMTLLGAYGVPVLGTRTVGDVEAAVAAAAEIGYPVVLKSTAPWLRHRPDLGGVRLDLLDEDAVRGAFAAIPSGDPVIVQEMAAPGVATVVGIVDDPSFGALVSFGLGGVATDLLGDRAYRTVPLTDLDAAELVRAPRAWPLLDGYRGSEPVDVAALEDLLLRVARLADDLPEVLRLSLEPVIVGPPHPWHGGRSLVVAGGAASVGPPTARVAPGPRRMRSPV
jgi:acyl-CoA synthetase (NDP forming)